MGTATEQIRVSDAVKQELERRMREDESYNDVLERLLAETGDTDFYNGFGILTDRQADRIREQREQAKEQRKRRMRRLGDEEA